MNDQYEMAWPTKEDQVVPFYLLAGAVRKAFEATFELEDIAPDMDVPWTGPPLGKRELVTCQNPIERLKAEYLAYELEDQGRDKLDALIGLALQLGIEQGRRCLRSEESVWIEIKKMQEKGMFDSLKEPHEN